MTATDESQAGKKPQAEQTLAVIGGGRQQKSMLGFLVKPAALAGVRAVCPSLSFLSLYGTQHYSVLCAPPT